LPGGLDWSYPSPGADSHREAVDRISPDASQLFDLLKEAGGEGCYVFSLDPLQPGTTAYARFFNPTVGISEDPATGTAAGPLAAHLVARAVMRGPAQSRSSKVRLSGAPASSR
jgi:PhzF family phenazine biosynthesis protein